MAMASCYSAHPARATSSGNSQASILSYRPLDPVRLEAFYTQIQLFIDDLLDGRPASVPGEEGRANVEMVEAAMQSQATGQAVHLPLS